MARAVTILSARLVFPEGGTMAETGKAAGFFGSDRQVWRGDIRIAMMGPGPRILGHEMTGRVHKLGANVTSDSQGQPLKGGGRLPPPPVLLPLPPLLPMPAGRVRGLPGEVPAAARVR